MQYSCFKCSQFSNSLERAVYYEDKIKSLTEVHFEKAKIFKRRMFYLLPFTSGFSRFLSSICPSKSNVKGKKMFGAPININES